MKHPASAGHLIFPCPHINTPAMKFSSCPALISNTNTKLSVPRDGGHMSANMKQLHHQEVRREFYSVTTPVHLWPAVPSPCLHTLVVWSMPQCPTATTLLILSTALRPTWWTVDDIITLLHSLCPNYLIPQIHYNSANFNFEEVQ